MTDDTKALVAKLKQLWPSLRLLAAEAQDDYGERFPLALEAKHAATLNRGSSHENRAPR